MSLISIGKASRIYGVHPDTLRNWESTGKIKSIRTKGNHRRFEESDIRHCQIIEFWTSIMEPSKCKEWFNFLLQNDNMMSASYEFACHSGITNETEILRFMVVCAYKHKSMRFTGEWNQQNV